MTDLLQLLDRWEKETNEFLLNRASFHPKETMKRNLLLCKVMRIAAQDLQSAHNITQDTRLRNHLRESLERIQGLMRNEK